MAMRTIETKTGITVDVQPSASKKGIVLIVFNGEAFALTSYDAKRVSEALVKAADDAGYGIVHNPA